MITPFARTRGGEGVDAIALSAGGITARILTYGAILNEVRLTGIDRNLTTAPTDFADYEADARYHGALIGPVVNRLTGAMAPIAGRLHRFAPNENSQTLLHSGAASTGARLWQIDTEADPPTPSSVSLKLTLPDGDGGFPGLRQVIARYAVCPPGELRLTVTATTDAPTLFNFANHSYWNLDGTPTWAGHSLQIAADRYLTTTSLGTPTGEIIDVTGSHYDLRSGATLGPEHPPLDTNFCLSGAPQPIRDVLWLTGRTGLRMTMATTASGVQIYDGRVPRLPGQSFYQALAIEAQGWPDAPNNAAFPPIEFGPGESFHQVTAWRFAAF